MGNYQTGNTILAQFGQDLMNACHKGMNTLPAVRSGMKKVGGPRVKLRARDVVPVPSLPCTEVHFLQTTVVGRLKVQGGADPFS